MKNPQSAIDFERFHDLILARTGMMFGPRRRGALTRGVQAAARRIGCNNVGEYYYLLLQARTDAELWDDLIGAITVGETYFFRDPSQITALRQHILPDLIARHSADRRLRIWSAGCASGEEPYSLAILLHGLVPDIAHWNVSILATDINKGALQKAREGKYREWSFRATDPAIRQRYFTHLGDDYELMPLVRKMVTFAYLNLSEDAYPSLATNTNAVDLIVCRNVAIYLPEIVILDMAARFCRCLVPEGWLMVGAAETNSQVYARFATRNFDGATVYQKTERLGDKVPWSLGDAKKPPRPGVTLSPHLPFPPLPVPTSPHLPVTPPPRPEPACGKPSRRGEGPRPEPLVVGPKDQGPAPPAKVKEPAELCQEGIALVEQGRYDEAKTRLQECLAGDPDFALAHYQMARALANQGQLDDARSWCQQAVTRDPLLTEAHYTMALIHQEQNELDQAIAQLKKTLYLDPTFVLAHFTLANLYLETGRPEQAARQRTQTIRLAAKIPPDDVVPGSDGLTAGRLLTMVQATV